MANKATPEAPPQAQSVVEHLWQLQHSQYSNHQVPGPVPHPAQAHHAHHSAPWSHGGAAQQSDESPGWYVAHAPRRSGYSARIRSNCYHCGKRGHTENRCYTKFPHLRPTSKYPPGARVPQNPSLPTALALPNDGVIIPVVAQVASAEPAQPHCKVDMAQTVVVVANPQLLVVDAVVSLLDGSQMTPMTVSGCVDVADETASFIQPALPDKTTSSHTNTWDDVRYGASQEVKSPSRPPRPQRRNRKSRNGRTKKERKSHVTRDPRTTIDSSPSSPIERIRDDLASSPVTKEMPRPSIPNGWGNFFVHIKQDDVVMQVKAKEDYKRQGGDTFRPEMKETYKDQRGKKETKVHEKVGGRTGGKSGTARDDQRDVRKEESPEGGVRLEHGLISDELVRAD